MFPVGTSWIDQPVFFVDFEGSRTSGVLEFGVVELLRGEIVGTTTALCRACGEVRAEDTAVHGLRSDMLRAWQPFADQWEFFAGLRERGPLAAHYAGVENALLKAVWPYPRSSPHFAGGGGRAIDWGPWIDTARIYGQLYPRLLTGRLQALVEAIGAQPELDRLAERWCPRQRRRYHCALYDALAGSVLLLALARDDDLKRLSLLQLLTLSTLDPQKREALEQPELF